MGWLGWEGEMCLPRAQGRLLGADWELGCRAPAVTRCITSVHT